MSAIATAFADESTLEPLRLDAQIIAEIREGLGSYARFARVRAVALLDPTGAIIIRWEGPQRRDDLDLDALGVLATASFGATKALARRLGDESFGGICHDGGEHCLYIAPLVRGYMLLTLHRPGIHLEELRQSLNRIVPRLNQQLVREISRDGRRTA